MRATLPQSCGLSQRQFSRLSTAFPNLDIPAIIAGIPNAATVTGTALFLAVCAIGKRERQESDRRNRQSVASVMTPASLEF